MRAARSVVVVNLVCSMLLALQSAGAQETRRVYRGGVLQLTSPTPAFDAFRTAMRDLGWVEGQVLVIDYRGADGKGERLDQLAREIVASRPNVIVTGTNRAAVAAKRATSTIPIVMAVSADPVGLGVVKSGSSGGEHHRAGHSLSRTPREAPRDPKGILKES